MKRSGEEPPGPKPSTAAAAIRPIRNRRNSEIRVLGVAGRDETEEPRTIERHHRRPVERDAARARHRGPEVPWSRNSTAHPPNDRYTTGANPRPAGEECAARLRVASHPKPVANSPHRDEIHQDHDVCRAGRPRAHPTQRRGPSNQFPDGESVSNVQHALPADETGRATFVRVLAESRIARCTHRRSTGTGGRRRPAWPGPLARVPERGTRNLGPRAR
jgi:hypothetical protein